MRIVFKNPPHAHPRNSAAVAAGVYQVIGNATTKKIAATGATKMNRLAVSYFLNVSPKWGSLLRITGQRVCGADEFTCRSAAGECVPLTWMCDDNPDCSDSSDEKACSKF